MHIPCSSYNLAFSLVPPIFYVLTYASMILNLEELQPNCLSSSGPEDADHCEYFSWNSMEYHNREDALHFLLLKRVFWTSVAEVTWFLFQLKGHIISYIFNHVWFVPTFTLLRTYILPTSYRKSMIVWILIAIRKFLYSSWLSVCSIGCNFNIHIS